MHVQIAISLNLRECLTYSMPESAMEMVGLGSRVVVPIGNRLETGWITGMSSTYSGRTRPVAGWIRDSFRLSPHYLSFAAHAAQRFILAPGVLMDGALSPRRRNRRQIRMLVNGKSGPSLSSLNLPAIKKNAAQLPAEFIISSRGMDDPAYSDKDSMPGAGFSEQLILAYDRGLFYRELIASRLSMGLSVLLLTADRRSALAWMAELPGVVAYHSLVSVKERESIWSRTAAGEPMAVAGGQSALLLPFSQLGAIVVDQPSAWQTRPAERESEVGPELARLRAAVLRIPFIQGDHTYPLPVYRRRSFARVQDRRGEKPLETEVLPLQAGIPGIPQSLLQRISVYIASGRRVLIIVNRLRGEEFLFCPQCRQTARCPHCGHIMLPGKAGDHPQVCPHCNSPWKSETRCPRCQTEWLRVPGVNLESLRDQVEKRILGSAPPIITADSPPAVVEAAASAGGCAVVMGTWAALRPEFRHVFSAIIYFRPESDFHFSGYSAAEQVHAAVGRMREWVVDGGVVDVFSAFHFHYGLRSLHSHEDFLQRESKYRRWFHLPPYTELFQLVFRDSDKRKLAARMREARKQVGTGLNIMETRLESTSPSKGKWNGIMHIAGSVTALRLSGILNQRDVQLLRKS